MSQEVGQTELKEKTQQLLRRAAEAYPGGGDCRGASAAGVGGCDSGVGADVCASGGVCGVVLNDTNSNGIQDAGEPGIEGVKVSVSTCAPA